MAVDFPYHACYTVSKRNGFLPLCPLQSPEIPGVVPILPAEVYLSRAEAVWRLRRGLFEVVLSRGPAGAGTASATSVISVAPTEFREQRAVSSMLVDSQGDAR